jgi:hypothetical protein
LLDIFGVGKQSTQAHCRQAKRKNDLLSFTIVNPSADGFSIDN